MRCPPVSHFSMISTMRSQLAGSMISFLKIFSSRPLMARGVAWSWGSSLNLTMAARSVFGGLGALIKGPEIGDQLLAAPVHGEALDPEARSRALTLAAPTFSRRMSVAELSLIIIIRWAMFRTLSLTPGAASLRDQPAPRVLVGRLDADLVVQAEPPFLDLEQKLHQDGHLERAGHGERHVAVDRQPQPGLEMLDGHARPRRPRGR